MEKDNSVKIFEEKQSLMSDKELIERADIELSKLCKSYGAKFTMSIPARITDTDMIFSELIKRYKSTI